jgi:hypothetical protein
MNPPVWVLELAHRFWTEAGGAEPFPRRLRDTIQSTLPIAIQTLPQLSVNQVLAWLRRRGIAPSVHTTERRLRGCMVAGGGYGFLFLDADDPADEQRFTLAHELAHFLRDYWEPRRRLAAAFGSKVLEVCDGLRPARPEERLHALLRDLPLGLQVHLLHREDYRPASRQEEEAEEAADLLALELLAPASAVLARTNCTTKTALQCHLQAGYGLPSGAAAQYAALLLPPPPPADPIWQRLQESVRISCRTSTPAPE